MPAARLRLAVDSTIRVTAPSREQTVIAWCRSWPVEAPHPQVVSTTMQVDATPPRVVVRPSRLRTMRAVSASGPRLCAAANKQDRNARLSSKQCKAGTVRWRTRVGPLATPRRPHRRRAPNDEAARCPCDAGRPLIAHAVPRVLANDGVTAQRPRSRRRGNERIPTCSQASAVSRTGGAVLAHAPVAPAGLPVTRRSNRRCARSSSAPSRWNSTVGISRSRIGLVLNTRAIACWRVSRPTRRCWPKYTASSPQRSPPAGASSRPRSGCSTTVT